MTAPSVPTIDIQAPLPHQERWMDLTHRFLVGRCGRRTGKSRFDFIHALIGRGPGWAEQRPMFPGVFQGWDVPWVAPDYPQALGIWFEEIEPRFREHPLWRVNATDMRAIFLPNGASLYIRSAENVESIRGLGKRVKGVIFDEGAHMDLEYAWTKVVRPILMDNEGWATFTSTTNSGPDGGVDEQGQKLVPSFFNRLCQEVIDGARAASEGWGHFHATARENPKIKPAEFASLQTEYKNRPIAYDEEIEAKLLPPGAGLAFPEWNTQLHTYATEVPDHWRWYAGMDWGYAKPGVIVLAGAGPTELWPRWEFTFREMKPYDVGYSFIQAILGKERLTANLQLPEFVACDSSMWAVTDGGPTIAEFFQAGITAALKGRDEHVAAVPAPKGAGSRVARAILLHEYLAYDKALLHTDPTSGVQSLPPWAQPRLRVHRIDCPYLVRTLPVLPRDERNQEDVDTEADDHSYDALTYLLTMRPEGGKAAIKDVPTNRHPGFGPRGQRRPRDPLRQRLEAEDQARLEPAPGTFRTGFSYRLSPADEDE